MGTAGAIFQGSIILWAGSIENIPTGWFLCDGDNGTPDLQDKFIIGAGNTYDPDDTGGSASHIHAVSIASHFHILGQGKAGILDSGISDTTSSDGDTSTSNSANNLPPYYALAFIYNPEVPQGAFPGSIVLWSGSIASIPRDWNLCDGDNSTPDLQDKFIIGAGNTYNVGDNSSGTTHTHSGTTDGHNHTIAKGSGNSSGSLGTTTSTNTDTYETNASTLLPPFYSLAYIQNTHTGTLGIFTGMIVWWTGTVVGIPRGFALCDGNNSTPDLTDQFVVGAGNTYVVDETGGTDDHSHTGNTDGHFHTMPKAGSGAGGGGGSIPIVFLPKTPSLTTDTVNHLPEFYALANIIKT